MSSAGSVGLAHLGYRLGRCLFGTLSRHFLTVFLVRFFWVFAFIQLFIALCSLLVFLWKFPFISPLKVLQGLPDHVLVTLPLTSSFATFVAGLLFCRHIRRDGGFLQIHLAGHDPRFFQLPLVLFGLLLSGLLYLHNGSILPTVLYHSRYPLLDPAELNLSLPPVVLKSRGPMTGFTVGFTSSPDGGVADVSLCRNTDKGNMIIRARSGSFRFSDQPIKLDATLAVGRILAIDPFDKVNTNIKFDRLDVGFDVGGVFRRPKSTFLHLRYYTNLELNRLEAQRAMNLAHGVRITNRQSRKLASVHFTKMARIHLALAPLFFLVAILIVLGRHRSRWVKIRQIILAVGCLGLYLLPATIFTFQPHPFSTPFVALLPLLMVWTLLGISHWVLSSTTGGR